jgi:hypothetical protein
MKLLEIEKQTIQVIAVSDRFKGMTPYGVRTSYTILASRLATTIPTNVGNVRPPCAWMPDAASAVHADRCRKIAGGATLCNPEPALSKDPQPQQAAMFSLPARPEVARGSPADQSETIDLGARSPEHRERMRRAAAS